MSVQTDKHSDKNKSRTR